MKTLVTGSGGFLGRHLTRRLAGEGSVVAFSRSVAPNTAGVLQVTGDITNPEQVNACIQTHQPDRIIHAAAQSYPSVSWEHPAMTFDVNVQGTTHLLDAVRTHVPSARILMFSSSAAYGPVTDGKPIPESSHLTGQSPYAISKAACDWMSQRYAERYGLNIMIARPFFVFGPEKAGDVASDFASGALAVERGEAACMSVGNLEAVRDFLPLSDALTACTTLLDKGEAGEAYNICSGEGRAVQDLLDEVCSHVDGPVRVEQDPAKMRPLDEPIRVGDNQKLRALGWTSQQSFSDAVKELVEHTRKAMS